MPCLAVPTVRSLLKILHSRYEIEKDETGEGNLSVWPNFKRFVHVHTCAHVQFVETVAKFMSIFEHYLTCRGTLMISATPVSFSLLKFFLLVLDNFISAGALIKFQLKKKSQSKPVLWRNRFQIARPVLFGIISPVSIFDACRMVRPRSHKILWATYWFITLALHWGFSEMAKHQMRTECRHLYLFSKQNTVARWTTTLPQDRLDKCGSQGYVS